MKDSPDMASYILSQRIAMKYRIKAYHYKKESRYYPQYKFLWLWNDFGGAYQPTISFSSKMKAKKWLDDYIDKANPKIEWIPYE